MKDEWQSEIDMVLQPLDALGPVIMDTTYFLKDTGAFTYTEGYFHPPGHFLGKIINYPEKKGDIEIHGRSYTSITKAWINGEHVMIPHDEQIKQHYRVDAGLKPPELTPVVTDFHVVFDLKDFVGWFSDKISMKRAMEKYPQIGRRIKEVSELLEVPRERLGVTGSLAYGRMEADEDIDLVFFGTPEQNMDTVRKIWAMTYNDPERRCLEFGKFWPVRFYHDGIIICTFCVYSDPKYIPLTYCETELVKESVQAFGTIVDNTHSIYMPLVLKLNDVSIDGEKSDEIFFVIYDGSIRGEFYVGERLKIEGRLIRMTLFGREQVALVSVDAGQIEKEQFSQGLPIF